MNQTIKDLYNLEVITFIKISSVLYKVKTTTGNYALKYINKKNDLNSIIAKLEMLRINTFAFPLKNKYNEYLSYFDNVYYILSPWYEEDPILLKDLKLKFYLKSLSNLHNKTFYTIKINEAFFNQTYDFIASKIDEVSQEIENYMSLIEKYDYKSPSEWLFLLNYPMYQMSIDNANKALEKFKKTYQDKKTLRLAFTYNNFDYNHIFLKEEKITGIEKFEVSSPVYDIFYTFKVLNEVSIDFKEYYQTYFKSFVFNEYEKEWLISLIFIPQIEKFSDDESNNIKNIINSINYLRNAQEIAQIIALKKEENKENNNED